MSGVAAGTLRHKVLLQRRILSQDSNGSRVFTWEDVANIWASVEPLSGRDYLAAQAAQSDVTARITIRHREIDPLVMRLVYRGRIYVIKVALQDKESGLEHVTLMCSQGVSEGL